jgi:hypothetical protein
MDFELLIAVIIAIFVFMGFVCFVCNTAFWQGYRNSKFLDELYKEQEQRQKETKELTNE